MGFHHPLKQNGVKGLLKKHGVDIFWVLECKLNNEKLQRTMGSKFVGGSQCNNFHVHEWVTFSFYGTPQPWRSLLWRFSHKLFISFSLAR